MTSTYDAALKPAGVNIAQFSLLRTIEREAPVSLSTIARLTELDRSTVGRNIKVLQRMGLVTTHTESTDQREAMACLTPKGRTVLRVGAPLWDKAQEAIETALGVVAAKRLRTLSQNL